VIEVRRGPIDTGDLAEEATVATLGLRLRVGEEMG